MFNIKVSEGKRLAGENFLVIIWTRFPLDKLHIVALEFTDMLLDFSEFIFFFLQKETLVKI